MDNYNMCSELTRRNLWMALKDAHVDELDTAAITVCAAAASWVAVQPEEETNTWAL